MDTLWQLHGRDYLVPVDHLLYSGKLEESQDPHDPFYRECVGSMMVTLMILSPLIWHLSSGLS